MTINFRRRFVDAILAGTKTQTIRKAGKRKFRVGQALQLYTGQRTGKCQKIMDAKVVELQYIEIDLDKYDGFVIPEIIVNGRPLTTEEIEELASIDGFETWDAFIEFFADKYPSPFYGRIIKWGPADGENTQS